MWFVLLSLLAVTSGGSAKSLPGSDGQCLTKDGGLYTLMSTMTPYDRVRGAVPEFKDCAAEGLWAFVRHGTRYPHDFEAMRYGNLSNLRDGILENHRQNRGELCPEDLAALKDWELVMDFNQSMLLSTSGVEELRRYGARMRSVYPQLLKDYSPDTVDVRITSSQRTRQSAEAFLTGLYGYSMKIQNSMIYDSLLKNDKNCSAWPLSTHSDKLKGQMELLKNSPDMRELLRSVSTRLGFKCELDLDTIRDIYDTCTLEYAWYHNEKTTPWCTAFTTEHLKIMEFREDLRYFYKSAFGNKLTKKFGCSFIKDMTDRLSKLDPVSTLYFGHSLGVRKLLTTLGIGEDIMLSGNSYSSSTDRKWKTSYLTPFTASVMGVRYQCKKGSHGIKETTRLAIFVNEKLKQLPACGGREMCGMEEFKEKFASIMSPEFCNTDFCES